MLVLLHKLRCCIVETVLDLLDFELQVSDISLFAFTECSLCCSVLCFTFYFGIAVSLSNSSV